MNVVTSVVPLRPKARELSDRDGTPALHLAGFLGSFLWLPAGIAAAEVVVAGGLPRLPDLDAWLYLAGLAVGGVPLARACGRLRGMGYGGGAYLAFGALAPATVAGTIFVAPFGMLWVWAWAGALSLPAWVPYGLRERARRRRWRNSRRLA